MCDCLNRKNYKPKLRNVIVIIIVSIAIDILARLFRDEIYSSFLLVLAAFFDKTIFHSSMTIVISVCCTIGSVTFSAFSFARTTLNNKKNVDMKYCELLGIEVFYNPYVFLAIIFQAFAFLIGYGTLFYLMVAYQIYSFKKCLTNYLMLIDPKKLDSKISVFESRLKVDDKNILKLIKRRFILAYEANDFQVNQNFDIFKKFDQYLYKYYNDDSSFYGRIDVLVRDYIKKSDKLLKDLLGDQNDADENYELILSLLITLAPSKVTLYGENEYQFFSFKNKNQYLFYQYFSFYYRLLFYLLQNSPEMITNAKFQKLLMDNAEVYYAIIASGFFLHTNKLYIPVDYIESYKICRNNVNNVCAVFIDEGEFSCIERILFNYWIMWYNLVCDPKNIYEISTQFYKMHYLLIRLQKIHKSNKRMKNLTRSFL